MPGRQLTFKTFLGVAAAALLVLGSGSAALAQADDSRTFPDTGFTVQDDAIWSYFNANGGVSTFGEPISREFGFQNGLVQVFQNAALAVGADGSVVSLPLASPGLLPFTKFDGLTVPPPNDAFTFVAPTSDQPNFGSRMQVFLQASIPDSWGGYPVNFFSTYSGSGGQAVWGLPTSAPTADPSNPNFIYQRFRNGILMYDASAGSTSPLPLGQYFKDVLTGQSLPGDLASESATSPLLRLGASNGTVSDAFAPDAA